jgi:hypothetical protein
MDAVGAEPADGVVELNRHLSAIVRENSGDDRQREQASRLQAFHVDRFGLLRNSPISARKES